MRAAVYHHYGAPEVVQVEEVPTPAPRDGEVLVRVAAAAVTAGDARLRAARFPPGFGVPARLIFGIRRPRRPILGNSLSGVVEVAAGGFAVGDEVCGMSGIRMGAHAEYVAVPVAKLTARPAGVTHEQAAGALFGGSTALYYLRDLAALQPGGTVLINGASGAVGAMAVQLAKHFGGIVTAVTSARNAELVTRLGADRIIDYTSTPVTELTERFDVVLDTVGSITRANGRRLLTDDGVLLLAVAGLADTIRARGNVKAGSSSERPEDFALLLDLVARGELAVVTEAVLPLDRIADAHRRIDSGRKVGNILITP